jgi:hypothetical protein
MTIETKFELAQEVYIPQLKTSGRVRAFYLTATGGVQYLTRYFNENHSPAELYLFEDELSDQIPASKSPGFAKEESASSAESAD